MTNDSKSASSLTTVLLLGGLFIVLSLACCAVVAAAALVLPRAASRTLTAPARAIDSPQVSDFPDWLPDRRNLPAGMKLVEEMRTSNQYIAEQQDDPQDYLQKLESFGREDGFSREYGSTDPCRTRGVRYVQMTLILHKDSAGAQRYVDWMEASDREAEDFKTVLTGDYGYKFWDSPYIDECSEVPGERMAMIFFRRGSVVAFVEVSAAEENNSDAEILSIAESIAQTLDARIQGR